MDSSAATTSSTSEAAATVDDVATTTTTSTTTSSPQPSDSEKSVAKSADSDNDNGSTTPEQAGISCFMNDRPGFSAILKQRYEDFHVTEVAPNGDLAVITELCSQNTKRKHDEHEETSSTTSTATDNATTTTNKKSKLSVDSDASAPVFVPAGFAKYLVGNVPHVQHLLGLTALRPFISTSDVPKLHRFFTDNRLHTVVLAPCTDKATRSSIHAVFRNKFDGLFVTDTVPYVEETDDGTVAAAPDKHAKLTCVRVRRNARNSRRQARQQQARDRRPRFDDRGMKQAWSGGSNDYIRFILWKENTDTSRMLSEVGRARYCC